MCALGLAAPTMPAAAQEPGRLFFTPAQRQALDRHRESGLAEHVETIEDAAALTIDGVVTRGGGRHTVWINGVARDGDGDGVPVVPSRANPGRIVVRTSDGSTAEAGVGDTVDPKTGETAALLGDGQVRVNIGPRR
jgi:hypothetical protein